jgi:AMP deaminase
MVDDESKPERRPTKHSAPPAEWNTKHNCAYSYYAYYIYANLYALNKFRCAAAIRRGKGEVERCVSWPFVQSVPHV